MLRRTAILGMEKSTLPPDLRVQVSNIFDSVAAAIAARPLATFCSNIARSSFVVLGGGGGCVFGSRSRAACSIVNFGQLGMLATWPASQIMVPDFSCGFHPN